MDGRRIFIAIDISDAARAVCSSHIESLRKEFPQVPGGWERPEKLHVTLKFLGPTSEKKIAGLNDGLMNVAAQHREFGLQLGRPGSFPGKGKPRVLWIGVEGAMDLKRLHTDVETVCESLGYEREYRSFHPHITIARIRDHRDAFALAETHRAALVEPVEFEVRSVVIYESKLLPSGSVYSKLANVSLVPR
jgi:2'-5' RNA ligase